MACVDHDRLEGAGSVPDPGGATTEKGCEQEDREWSRALANLESVPEARWNVAAHTLFFAVDNGRASHRSHDPLSRGPTTESCETIHFHQSTGAGEVSLPASASAQSG